MTKPFQKLRKALRLLADSRFRPALMNGVAATVEHAPAFKDHQFDSIVDVGANRGQFTLLMAGLFPNARIVAFEPLIEPFRKLLDVTASLPNVRAFNSAIGPERTSLPMNVSKRDDSSSLLPISALQETIFPHTGRARIDHVRVAPLGDALNDLDLKRPILLKIDVQGFELEVLKGSDDCLVQFDTVYVEASFVQLYDGQPLASEIIDFLHQRGFRLAGVYNLSHMASGQPVQADFLFERR